MTVTIPSLTPLPRGPNGEVLEQIFRNIQSDSGSVTTHGTRVKLKSASTEAKIIDIYNGNASATLYIGGTSVSSTKGIPIPPTFTYRLAITDLSLVWIDSDTDGATFSYNYQW